MLITQTIQLASVVPTYDHKDGDVADSVHISLAAEVRAYTYSESDVRTAVNGVTQNWVNTHYSSTFGPNLDMNTVQYAPPSVQSFDAATGKVVYGTTANGRVTFTLTSELARRIRDLVKGKEIKQARNLITEMYGTYLNTASIQARVLWLTIDKLPTDAAHISVESTTGPSVSPSGGTAPQTQGIVADPRSSSP